MPDDPVTNRRDQRQVGIELPAVPLQGDDERLGDAIVEGRGVEGSDIGVIGEPLAADREIHYPNTGAS